MERNKKPTTLPPLKEGGPKPAFFMPDVKDTVESRARVGKYLGANVYPVHVEEDTGSRRLVTRGGTDVSQRVSESNGHVFYEAHGGARPTGNEGKPPWERTLEFAYSDGVSRYVSRYVGEAKASALLADTFAGARTLTILSCNYGRGQGRALEAIAEKIGKKEGGGGEGGSGTTVRAPTVLFSRQTLPGPGVAPTPAQRKKIQPADRRRETMTKATDEQLKEMLGTKLWNTAQSKPDQPAKFPEITGKNPVVAREPLLPRINPKPLWKY